MTLRAQNALVPGPAQEAALDRGQHRRQPAVLTTGRVPAIIKRTLNRLDPNMAAVFVPWARRHPRFLPAFVRLSYAYKRSEKTRDKLLKDGLMVPPLLILSITSRCNLKCAGCYAAAAGTVQPRPSDASAGTRPPLNWQNWHSVISEASKLGVFCFIMAGGEPFLFPRLVELCREFKDRLFLIFTNGTALEASDYERLRSLTNTGVIVSIEGGPELTDSRRGPGVYSQALDTLKRLEDIGVLSGVSVTVDRRNFAYWMKDDHVDALIAEGVHFGFFIEYIPSSPAGESSESENSTQAAPSCANAPSYLDELSQGIAGDDHLLMLTSEERASFRQQILRWRSEKSIYLIHSPGDEEFLGGCVSAGRGFAHVTPAGDVTPCPVSNVATHNLFDTSLKEALASPLFEQIRENEDLLETGDTPCGLFAHPKEVERLAKAVGAYRTDAREE